MKTGNKEHPKKDTWLTLGREIRLDLLGEVGVEVARGRGYVHVFCERTQYAAKVTDSNALLSYSFFLTLTLILAHLFFCSPTIIYSYSLLSCNPSPLPLHESLWGVLV